MQTRLKKEELIEHFREMVRLKTVSSKNLDEETAREFARFRELLKKSYPAVFGAAEEWRVGELGLVIRIPGKSSDNPSVLMAHMDVVEADGSAWEHDPFAADYENGRIYGRGTLDTKCTLCAVMEAAELCVRSGIVPKHDLYLAFGGEEEISGKCCSGIVSFLEEKGVRPDFVLDEGGSLIPEGVPGVHALCAMIGVAEKGTANYKITIRSGSGGHSSVPPRSTVSGRLARAAVEIEENPFPARLSTASGKMFRELADQVPFFIKPVFLHPELASPAIRCAGPILGNTFNAMVRTTAAVTMLNGSSSYNVLPESASMGVNVRLLEGDTKESAARYLKSVISDPDAEVELVDGTDPTGISDTRCSAYRTLKAAIAGTWPGAVIAPYQMNGGTDARYYERLTDHIYRFSPMVMTKAERASVHGLNESISVDTLCRMAVFYIRLIKRL